jgi:hypothetical protein
MTALPDRSECLLDWDPEPEERPAQPNPTWYATTSQKAGLQRLHALADVFTRVGDGTLGTFRPLLRPLLIGATGCGKSTLVREFARQRDWGFLAVDAGSWLIQGAFSKPPTLRLIRDHVRAFPRTCLFIDECCKLMPTGHDANSGWYTSVFAEFLGLYDTSERLLGHEWTRADIQRFRESCFLIAGGAFTSALKQAQASAMRGGLGFGQAGPIAGATHSSKIGEILPPEIFLRFHSSHLVLEAPSRDDYARAIEMIHADLKVEREKPIKELIDEAQASGNGVRWVPEYLTRVLLANPTALPVKPAADAPKPPEGYDFFSPEASRYSHDITNYSFELRGVLARIRAEIQSQHDLVRENPSKAFSRYLLGSERGDFPGILMGALMASNACVGIGEDDSATLNPLMRWREEAWLGLDRFAGELSRCGLLDLFSRSWDLTSRIAELRATLSQMVAAGKFSARP